MANFSVQMQPFFQWLLRSTLQASLVICLILLIQMIVRNKLGIRWHHALWLILLIRMVLPLTPQSRLSIFNLTSWWNKTYQSNFDQIELPEQPNITSTIASFTTEPAGSNTVTNLYEQPKSIEPLPAKLQISKGSTIIHTYRARDIFPLVWLVGALVLGIYVIVSNVKLWLAISIEHPSTDKKVLELLEQCREKMGLRTIVALVESSKVDTPVLLGFIRPRLLIPKNITKKLNTEELGYIFLHELAHVKRNDIALAWLTAILQILHWFNPLVWLAFHRMRTDREIACDALVLTQTKGSGPKDYGRAIVNLMERLSFPPRLHGLAGVLESKSQLKRRIQMITKFKSNSYRWSPLAIILIVAIGCMSIPDARTGKTAESSTEKLSVSNGTPAAGTENSNEFVDPNTGIRFTKFKTFSGPNDVIEYTTGNLISSKGKFLLWGVKVIPLDGSSPFNLVDIPNAGRGSLSPDGRKVVFYAGAIWMIEVDPETGHPMSQPRKLLEGDTYWYQPQVNWSADSRRVILPRPTRSNGQSNGGGRTMLSVESGEISEVTDRFSFGVVSPDGKNVACFDQGSIWVKPVNGSEKRKIIDGENLNPLAWSSNQEWLLCNVRGQASGGKDIRLVHITDGHIVNIDSPGTVIIQYPQERKVFFYNPSYDEKEILKVVSVTGGQPAELGGHMSYVYPFSQFWSLDSKSIIMEGENKGNDWGLWSLPLSGAEPTALRMNISVPGEIFYRQLSPNLDYIFFAVSNDDNTNDLWLAPISWKELRTTGPAKLIFKNWDFMPGGGSGIPGNWSPDGKKIAIYQRQKGEIWIASVKEGQLVQLGQTGQKARPIWSPDSKMVAFYTTNSPTGAVVQVMPASGGEAKTVITNPPSSGNLVWSPDSKALTIANADSISSISISDGSSKTLVDLKEIDQDTASMISWSPDGKNMAFEARKGREPWQIFLFRSLDGHVEEIIPDEVTFFFWSPDSKWISYGTEQLVKVRPEGILWEMDVDEAIAKLEK